MTIEIPFPYTHETLTMIAARLEREFQRENEFAFRWQWQPFHAPFFMAAYYAVEEKWDWTFFETRLAALSCPAPPASLKDKFEKKGLLDEAGRIRSLDLEPVFRESFSLVKKNLDLFTAKKACLFTVAQLRQALSKVDLRWVPNLENPPEEAESSGLVSTLSSQSASVMKTFHALSPWQQLTFFEPLVGVAKSSSFLHFRRIDAVQ